MIHHFTIPGISVPYLRMTQKELRLLKVPDHKLQDRQIKKKRGIQRYLNYKDAVKLISSRHKYNRSPVSKIVVFIVVFFPNKKHGDPDNILKCILDALFDSDKYISSCVDYQYSQDSPGVDITILELEKGTDLAQSVEIKLKS